MYSFFVLGGADLAQLSTDFLQTHKRQKASLLSK